MRILRLLLLQLALALLAACGGGGPPAPAPSMPASQQEASARVGNAVARASVMQTSTLDESVARGYGIERSDRLALLVVGLRGGDAAAASVPARVSAKVTDLRGGVQTIPLRELRSGDLLDYVGTVEVDPPDTLRFDIEIAIDGASSTMQFTREIHPR